MPAKAAVRPAGPRQAGANRRAAGSRPLGCDRNASSALRVGAASVAFVEGLLRVRPSSVDPRQAAANNRMPSRLGFFCSSAFLRRSDAQPEEKLVHSSEHVIGAALWHYAYDYGELAYPASAKSPNLDQGYLARLHHER